MSIRAIHAIFECDGCGGQFGAEIDSAAKRPLKWSLMDIAEDALRGGFGFKQLTMHTREEGQCSIARGKHLCIGCTKAEDARHTEDCPEGEDCDGACMRKAEAAKRQQAGGCWVDPKIIEKLDLRRPDESVGAYMMRKGIRP